MTPQQRLKEIEEMHKACTPYFASPDVEWLISRVRALEAALEKYAEGTDLDWATWHGEAWKVLEGEE